MMKSYKKVLLGCSTALFSVMLNAQNSLSACISSDCNALGYTKTASACSGKAAIKCPFDTSKAYCADDLNNCQAGTYLKDGKCEVCPGDTYSAAGATSCINCQSGATANSDHTACVCDSKYKYRCTGTGYATGSGECGGYYVKCICSVDYKWSNGSCVPDTCGGHGYLESKPDSSQIGTGCNYKNYNSCTTVNTTNRTDNSSKTCYNCPSNPYGSGRGVLRNCNGTQYCCGSGGNTMSCDLVVTGVGGCMKY